MRRIFLAAPLLLAACAGPQWSKPGVSAAQAQADDAQCRYEAAALGRDVIHQAQLIHMCMAARGYGVVQ